MWWVGPQATDPSEPSQPSVPTEKQLAELAVEEAQVLRILTQVSVVRRECEIVSEAPGCRGRGGGTRGRGSGVSLRGTSCAAP